MPASAETLRKLARITVSLPDAGEDIEVRRFCAAQMLEAGVHALIRSGINPDTTEEDAAAVVDQARRITCACSVNPRIVPGRPRNGSEVCVHDLSDRDVLAVMSVVVEYYTGLFIGADRTADQGETVDPKSGQHRSSEDVVRERQLTIAHQVDSICRRYGLSPLDVMEWSNPEVAHVLGIMQGADVVTARQQEKAAKHGK